MSSRGRPTDPAIDRAVRAAVEAELAEHGWRGVTVDAVASRAGIARTTVYRRWGGASGLLLVLMGEIYERVPVADLGSVRADLIDLMRGVVRVWRDPAHVRYLAALVAAQDSDATLATAYRTQFEQRRAATAQIVRRGVARGELRAGTDPDLLLDLLAGLVAQRVLLRRRAFTIRQATAAVDMLLDGVTDRRR